MPYDPDGDPADFDPNDPEAVDEWLNHPNTAAMHEELGRQFAALPPEEQLAQLIPMMREEVTRRDDLAAVVAEQDLTANDPRRVLLITLNDFVMRLGERITALGVARRRSIKSRPRGYVRRRVRLVRTHRTSSTAAGSVSCGHPEPQSRAVA